MFFDDLFRLSLNPWRWTNITNDVSGERPEGLSGHVIATCGNLLYLFGGIAKSGEFYFNIRRIQ